MHPLVGRAVLAGAVLAGAVLAPQPVGAADLGGYELSARSDAIHVEVFDPTIPVPAAPEGDIGVGHAKSTGSSGPSTRGTASALWPGDVLGDGFGTFAEQFGGDPNTRYPDQINAFYPTQPNSAKQDFAPGTGNGEYVDASDKATDSHVQLAGLAASGSTGTSPSGLAALLGAKPSPAPAPAGGVGPGASPVPVGPDLGALVQTGGVTSSSVITYGRTSVGATAHTHISDASLLGGVITVKGVDLQAQSTSQGSASSSSVTATVTGVSVAGQDLGIGLNGVQIGPTGVAVGPLSAAADAVLKAAGISIAVVPGTNSTAGGSTSVRQTGLVLTVDTAVLKAALHDPGSQLSKVVGPVLDQLPQNDRYSKLLVSALYGLLDLGPRIVISIGDVETKASASDAFVAPPAGVPVTLNPNPGVVNAPGGVGDSLGNIGAGPQEVLATTVNPGSQTAPKAPPPASAYRVAAQPLPPLGHIPPGLILAAVGLAAAIGWTLQAWGGPFAAGAARVGSAFCSAGLDTDLPNLREG